MTSKNQKTLRLQLQMYAQYMKEIAAEIENIDLENLNKRYHRSLYRDLILDKTTYPKLLREEGFDFVDDKINLNK